MATATAGLLVFAVSCTDDEPFEAARPLVPTTAPASDLDTSEPATTSDTGTEQPDEASEGQGVDATPETGDADAEGETTGAEAVDNSSDGEVSTPVEPVDDEAAGAAEAPEPAPPTAVPPSSNGANRPAPAATNGGAGAGTTLSGPDLIAGQPPRPEAPTPQPPPPDADDPNVPPTEVASFPPTGEADFPPSPQLPETCFGRTVDECTGEVIPEGAVTQMGEYQTNVRVPLGKAVDIYFDQARSFDEMSHLCGSMGGTLRQRSPDGSRWSGWWFCDDVVP